LENLAAAAAAAFEKAALYQSLKQRAEALQHAYDELREAERIKDSLLQSLSHELKTPLHKIIMQLQILDDEMYGSLNAEQHSSLRAALGWSAQLASIVDEIVIVQALSADDLHFAAVDLARLTAQAIRKVRLLAGELQLEIAVEISPNLPPVRGDERHLLTVVEQLLDNAVKFSPEGAQIEVKIAQDSASTVLLCVRDHGIGIPEALHARIFERGYQAESGITRRFGGVGLGLAMVRRIVEAHNGKVWVESAVGEGSAFYVQLPAWT
jgi:signal transduction histidine kinase